MIITLVNGLQWGDEGKGKIVHYLTDYYPNIIRYQGGSNSGHTVVTNNEKQILHILPTGILNSKCRAIIGNGVVVDLSLLKDEISKLGTDIGKLYISKKAHIVLSYHKYIEQYYEEILGNKSIGTTKQGIGPTYADKALRIGIRILDILEDNDKIYNLLKRNVKIYNHILNYYKVDIDRLIKDDFNTLIMMRDLYKDSFIDMSFLIESILSNKENILLEGSQGCMLDIDHGTYPYVTSSNSISSGALVGGSIPLNMIDRVIGVIKIYSTRVGNGPFPSECDNEVDQRLSNYGDEYGATTKRKRRCGWLDFISLRSLIKLNGTTSIIINKIDIMSHFHKIGFYGIDNVEEVIYKDSWYGFKFNKNISWNDLPYQLLNCIDLIENELSVDIVGIGIGPHTDDLIIKDLSYLI